MEAITPLGHSPNVDLQLLVDDEQLPLAQVSVDCFKLRTPREIPPRTKARIIVTIDGRRTWRDVFLHEGVRVDSEWTPFQ